MNAESRYTRYERQMLIPGWGRKGQDRLRAATVFIAGAGGLGSPAAIYLAAAGVGALRVCDCGAPELSNLNRQILYCDDDIGTDKAHAACAMLRTVNPDVTLVPLAERITEAGIASLVGESDIIIDCLDTFETRHVVNRFAVSRRIPLVHAGIYGLCGQLTFIHQPETPCLGCFYPGTTTRELFPVAGPTAGVIGALEALEAIKWIVGIGTLLKGRLLIWDGESMEFHQVPIFRNHECRVCRI
jgi:molybdopterin-synthase adenylyltransferase